jgi:cytoskeletal protein CcmA (bactofilin family)
MGQTGQIGQVGQNQGGKTTLIEDDTEFKGTLSSKCPVVVKGSIQGEVAGPSLHVSTSGSVAGKVKVGQLRSEGVIAGEFDADVVHLAGTVKSDTVIRARSLEVRLAPPSGRMQVTFGQCELAVGDVPSKEDAVTAAANRPTGKAAEAAAAAAAASASASSPSDEVPTQVRDAKREGDKSLDRAATEAEPATSRSRSRDSSRPNP